MRINGDCLIDWMNEWMSVSVCMSKNMSVSGAMNVDMSLIKSLSESFIINMSVCIIFEWECEFKCE